MYKIRIHGRGGQGARLAAKIIGMAAYLEGKNSQAFSIYGAERRGAPVAAFVRIDNKEILERGYIHDPDCVIVLDKTLLASKELGIFNGLKKGGLLIINSKFPIKGPSGVNTVNVDATTIAMQTIGKPIFNTAMLGSLVKLSNIVKLDSIKEAVMDQIGKRKKHLVEQNLKAIQRCYNGCDSKCLIEVKHD
jgi:pyruvate ferredoxin oxidoreductase gamma subunit